MRFTMTAYKRGVTIVEVMVAGGLFALFTTMVGRALVMAYRNHDLQTEKITSYRRSCAAINLLAKELQECQCLTVPAIGMLPYGSAYPVGNDHFSSLQFFRADIAQGWYLSEWLHDPVAKTVVRKIYVTIAPPQRQAPPGFSPYVPGALVPGNIPPWEPKNGRLMLQHCKSFTFTRLDNPNIRFVRVEAVLDKVAAPLMAEVKVREL